MKTRFFILSVLFLFGFSNMDAQTILTENFEKVPPDGWLIVETAEGHWRLPEESEEALFNNTGGCAFHPDSAQSSDWLITPVFTLNNQYGYIKFSTFLKYPSYPAELSIIALSAQDTNTIVDTLVYHQTSGRDPQNEWVDTALSLAKYSGRNICIAFKYEAEDMQCYWLIDSVSVFYWYDQDLAVEAIDNFITLDTGKAGLKVLVANTAQKTSTSGYGLTAEFTGDYAFNTSLDVPNTLEAGQKTENILPLEGIKSGKYTATVSLNYTDDQYTANNTVAQNVIVGYTVNCENLIASDIYIYDNGGPYQAYINDQTKYSIISPDLTVGDTVVLALDSVSLAPQDTIFIYDGKVAEENLLAAITEQADSLCFKSTPEKPLIIAVYQQNNDNSYFGFSAHAYTASGFTPVSETSIQQIVIFPNPATKYTIIQNAKGTLLTIFDINGKKITEQAINSNYQKIDVSTLSKGLYLLRLHSNSISYTQKLLIR